MIVFSNTTPIIALSSIDRLDLLPALFQEIYVVDTVIAECMAGGKISVPDLTGLPWVRIVRASGHQHNLLMNLDKGERDTLMTASEMKADYVIIDEKMGRNISEYLGFSVTGTLGILLKAKQSGRITSFSNYVKIMRNLGIRYNINLVKRLAQQVGESFY
jgi:predicted nucleic acid-binding protein